MTGPPTIASSVRLALWRSCPSFIALKLLRPRTKSVLFLHSAVDVHVFDRVLNRLAMWLAEAFEAQRVITFGAPAQEGADDYPADALPSLS